MVCGQCRHWVLAQETFGVVHIRRGHAGACARAEGPCANEQSQYIAANDLHPRVRYEREPAGAHFAPRES